MEAGSYELLIIRQPILEAYIKPKRLILMINQQFKLQERLWGLFFSDYRAEITAGQLLLVLGRSIGRQKNTRLRTR